MADQQRIHPVDVEAPSPSAPLVPRHQLGSDKGDPAEQQHPPVASSIPPPHRRTIPVSHSSPPKRRGRGGCCRCLCWTACLLLLLVVLLAATAGVLYLVFRPRLPKYSVDRLQVSAFAVDAALNVDASFDVTVTATNPNKKVGIYYSDGSRLSVWYDDTRLCAGSFPGFYQGHRNTTVLVVVLTGRTQVGGDLLAALQEQQQTGRVPLVFRGEVPVRVKLGALKLWKVRFLVTCNLVVNSLSVDNKIQIKTSSCKFRLRL
uniref:Putative syntaxin-24 n=1 Tax=Anthurium amnicola TaxID=1678845 RepID=A0A1D1YMS7_9ARAE